MRERRVTIPYILTDQDQHARPCPKCDPPPVLTCCGQPMIYQEFFGVRRYQCDHRAHHPAIYVNQNTGERVTDEDLPWGRP